MSINHSAANYFLKSIHIIERLAAYAQGKGYGAGSIKQEVKLVQQLSRTRPTLAVDIGGNVGEYTAELRRINKTLEIHTFEPSATNLHKLNTRFKLDSLVKIVPFAVSDTSGFATLFSNQLGSGLGSLTERRLHHLNIPFNAKETVSTVKFEDYWKKELNERQLDIVKIDIEGHELSALKGFGTALKSTRVVQFEFGGCNIDTRTYFQDFWYFFAESNFTIYRITPFGTQIIERYRESEESFSTTNYIAVNRS